MNYEFPKNLTLDEVRSVITAHNLALGSTSFIEADRGDHAIFNYLVAFEGSFPEPNTGDPAEDRFRAIIRECRGLTFDKATGKVISRKFAKFFNVNEKPETQIGLIDWSKPHWVLEKLDGSMITPFPTADGIRFATKMGLTEVAAPVDRFVAEKRAHYIEFVGDCIAMAATPMFEWCSRDQKIVLDYPEDRLVLTAIRDNASGEYFTYDAMVKLAEHYGIEVVRALPGGVANIHEFMAAAQDLEGAEGYVIRFADGHMVKVKGAWYCQIHKTKDMIQNEKDVWALILEDRIDDAKAFMDDGDRDRISRFHDAFEHGIAQKAAELETLVDLQKIAFGGDKKRFAMDYATKVDPMLKGILFSIWDGMDGASVVRKVLRKYVGSGPRLETVRHLVGVNWRDYRDTNYVTEEA